MYELLPKFVRGWLLENVWKYPNVVGFSEALMPRIRTGQLTNKEVIRFYVESKVSPLNLRYQDLIPPWIGIRNKIRKTWFDVDVVPIGRPMGPQPIPPLAGVRRMEIDKTANFRPVELGVSVGNELITAGSLGMLYLTATESKFVYDKILSGSNAHVLSPDPTWSVEDVLKSGKIRILQRGAYHGGKVPDDVVGNYLWHQQVHASNLPSDCSVSKGVVWSLNKIASLFGRQTRFKAYIQQLLNTIDFALYEPTVEHKMKVADDSIDVHNKPFIGHLFGGSEQVGVLCKISEILKIRPDIKPVSDWVDPKVGDKVKGCSFWCNYETEVTDVNATVNVGGYGGPTGIAIFQNCVLVSNANVIKGGWSGSGWFKV